MGRSVLCNGQRAKNLNAVVTADIEVAQSDDPCRQTVSLCAGNSATLGSLSECFAHQLGGWTENGLKGIAPSSESNQVGLYGGRERVSLKAMQSVICLMRVEMEGCRKVFARSCTTKTVSDCSPSESLRPSTCRYPASLKILRYACNS